jgi:hypothetical protein
MRIELVVLPIVQGIHIVDAPEGVKAMNINVVGQDLSLFYMLENTYNMVPQTFLVIVNTGEVILPPNTSVGYIGSVEKGNNFYHVFEYIETAP